VFEFSETKEFNWYSSVFQDSEPIWGQRSLVTQFFSVIGSGLVESCFVEMKMVTSQDNARPKKDFSREKTGES
jgi:hypothetical protein